MTVGGWKEGSDDCLSQNQIDWYSLLYDWGLISTASLSNFEVIGGRPAPSVRNKLLYGWGLSPADALDGFGVGEGRVILTMNGTLNYIMEKAVLFPT